VQQRILFFAAALIFISLAISPFLLRISTWGSVPSGRSYEKSSGMARAITTVDSIPFGVGFLVNLARPAGPDPGDSLDKVTPPLSLLTRNRERLAKFLITSIL
jgi:hypothetical protein